MQQIARIILGILLLRNGPQDLPARPQLLQLAALCLALAVFASQLVIGASLPHALLPALFSVLVLAAFIVLVLRAGGRRERFLQSFMALAFTGAVLQLLELGPTLVLQPYLLKAAGLLAGQNDPELARQALLQLQLPVLPVLLLCALFAWRIVVMAQVFRHALEIRMSRALGIALLYPAMLVLLTLLGSRF